MMKNIRAHSEKFRKNEEGRFRNASVVDKILEIDQQSLRLRFVSRKNGQFKNMVTVLLRKVKGELEEIDRVDMGSFVEGVYGEIFDNLDKKNVKAAKELLDKFSVEHGVEGLWKLSKYLDKIEKSASSELALAEKQIDQLVNTLGNFLHESVPIDNNEDNNVVVFSNGEGKREKLGHVELGKKYNLIDVKRGINVAGNRGYFLTGMGVRLNMALMMYAMDFLGGRGYTAMSVPHFMTQGVAEKICQLQDYEETLYKINTSDPKYLIATSEQPLTGYYMQHKFSEGELPVRFAGISTCYRKETGRGGVDTLGIFRVHQFEKVEQFCITKSGDSWDMLEEMISNSKAFYDSLGIKYRVVNIVSSALNNAAAKKYDLEGYFASSGTYRELVSCSNCTDYFSSKLDIKDKHGNFVHMLNATLCANTRTICCLLEQNQTDEGILIPEVLRKYIHGYSDTHIKIP